MDKIKVLLVVGTLEMSRQLTKILSQDKELLVVAEANNAYTARDKIIECKPDVMLLCHNLPRMQGITFLERVMPQKPVNTLVIAEAEYEERAYKAGAKDFIALDKCKDGIENENICQRLKKLSNKGAARHIVLPMTNSKITPSNEKNDTIIAMGASTGGTEALAKVIRGLKKDVPGVVIVQHMPEGFTQMYAERLDNEGVVAVKEAKSGDIVKPGHVLLAPGDRQMRIVKINGVYQVECRVEPKVSGHCPSVDVLFESVAKVAGRKAIGVIMTGMGSDGAKGLLAMKQAGAQTIGQDEKSCVVYGMPRVAYEMGAVDWQVPLEQIPQKIHYLADRI
jgi:two-component system chemotaxis response regulator CheB